MSMKKAVNMLTCLGLSASLLAVTPVAASTEHYQDSSKASDWATWTKDWETVATDYTQISVAPGADESQLNFAWYSASGDAEPVIRIGKDESSMKEYKGSRSDVDSSLTGGTAYVSNKVTVTDLEPSTEYTYSATGADGTEKTGTVKTGNPDDTKILYVGDPQIGASKDQTQGSDTLTEDDGAANTAARNDAFSWDRTLDLASGENPDLSFIISAGDQINKTGKPKEEEYAGFLHADLLQTTPLATTIGNHDSLNPDYSAHFNTPNATENGKTAAGGDYYYSYGNALFIVLNTNNYNVAEHEETIKEATGADPDAKWRIVAIHQDIYGSGLDHSETDGMILRTQLTPVFDSYDIDVVLQGHDHTYSRTKLLYGDGKTHGSYEFRLNSDGSDYDWDHAYNKDTDAQIPLSEDAASSDAASSGAESQATETYEDFQNDNKCYTIEDVEGSTVKNPQGTLYMTANSASGSKYYELAKTQQDYVAVRSQNWLPSYSVIEVTDKSFAITTYQVTDDGKAEKLDDTFTIEKD